MKKHDQKRWVNCDVEVEFLGEDRKSGKAQRKRAMAKDRSKYKKTDLPEEAVLMPMPEHLSRGRVLSITPQGILVQHEDTSFTCTLRGVMKKERTKFKNLITVGDWVWFEQIPGKEGLIVSVEPRKTVLMRADNLSQRKAQLIASNIDQVLITVSVVSPPLKPPLVDRYIIAAKQGGMQPVIVVNKIDLLKNPKETSEDIENELELYIEFLSAYKIAGIPVIAVSADTGEGLDELRKVMENRSSVFSGQSGVGKSSILNAIAGFDLRVGHVVLRTKKGTHTTTTASLLHLPFGGWCIDTPGIKSFGVWELKRDEIESYFFEIHECGKSCKYPSCTHSNEPGCSVIQALDEGKISLLRYSSYQFLLEKLAHEHLRR